MFVGNKERPGRDRNYIDVDFHEQHGSTRFLCQHLQSEAIKYAIKHNIQLPVSFAQIVERVFYYSVFFALPFPRQQYLTLERFATIPDSYEPHRKKPRKNAISAVQGITTNISTNESRATTSAFTENRSFYESYRQLEVENLNVDDKIQLVELRALEELEFSDIGFGAGNTRNESELRANFMTTIFLPLRSLISGDKRFTVVSYHEQLALETFSRPDCCLSVLKNSRIFMLPIELKLSGIYEAFKKKNRMYLDLTNQILYQMLSYRSPVGVLCDRESIIFIKLEDELPVLGSDPLTLIRTAKLKCKVYCYQHHQTSPSLILYSLAFNHFSKVTQADKNKIDNILKAMKLTDADKVDVEIGKYNFIKAEWQTRFKHFEAVGDYLIRNDAPDIKIRKEFLLDFRATEVNFNQSINEEDFSNLFAIQINEPDKVVHHSKVFTLTCNSGINRGVKMVLKVYDAVSSPDFEKHTHARSFHLNFSFCLSMYLNELRAFSVLRKVNNNGVNLERPVSKEGRTETTNATPYLYSSGLIDWPSRSGRSGHERICGFFLLMDQVPQNYPSSEFEYQNLAAISLKSIHERGLIHGDIKYQNFKYDATKRKVIFYDFGLSRFDIQRFSKKSAALLGSTKAQQKEELVKLNEAVADAFRYRYSGTNSQV